MSIVTFDLASLMCSLKGLQESSSSRLCFSKPLLILQTSFSFSSLSDRSAPFSGSKARVLTRFVFGIRPSGWMFDRTTRLLLREKKAVVKRWRRTCTTLTTYPQGKRSKRERRWARRLTEGVGRYLLQLILPSLALALLQQPVFAQEGSETKRDTFEFYGRAATNMQMFQRALLPGPGGAIVNQQFMAPIHQSVSARALGVDSPMGKDSLEIQIAGYGQVVPGADNAIQTATFDVASAFIKQNWQSASLSLGRQVVAGGAARYARFDGGKLAIHTDFGLDLTGYGGLTALPRWDQQYGYHNLGSNYEAWSTEDHASLTMARVDQWMVGMRAQLSSSKVGSIGFSYHQQAEQAALYRSTLGLDGSLTVIKHFEITGDALFSADSARFSDVRIAARVQAWDHKAGGLVLRGEFLHTVPSLMLSQSSVFSVFAFEEVTEAGGEASLGLPAGFAVEASAYGQMYQEGQPGLRAQAGASFVSDDDRTFFARVTLSRFNNADNGYVMLRSSLSYRLTEQLTALADLYQYRYDSPISSVRSSSFYAAHLAYQATSNWSGRIGASLARSPYASFDLQALARVEYQFDMRGR